MPRKMYKAEELCALSGLSRESLAQLKAAGLLRPNAAEQYRSKLVTWARKLAYLLDAGWSLPEIKTWARARWSAPNPRQWPPDRPLGAPQGSADTSWTLAGFPAGAC